MGKNCGNQSVNAGNGVLISGGALDKMIKLFERSIDLEEKEHDEKETYKDAMFGEHIEFIKDELRKVEKAMTKTDIHSDEYRGLIQTYDGLLNTIRFI